MRTLEELKELLNPDGAKNVWKYVPVKHTYVSGAITEDYYHIHEVHFDDDGNFRGATDKARTPVGNDVEDLKGELQLMLKGSENPLVTFEELNLIRS